MTSDADDLILLYNENFITHDTNEVPYKLLKIFIEQFEKIERVYDEIENLNDLSTNTGTSLDFEAVKWAIVRQGKTDDEMLKQINNKILIYFSGSTIQDFLSALVAFNAPSESKVIENLPPEFAEINIMLNNASVDVVSLITSVLNIIKGAGIQVEIYNNLSTGDKLLKEDGFYLVQESGDFILLE